MDLIRIMLISVTLLGCSLSVSAAGDDGLDCPKEVGLPLWGSPTRRLQQH